MIHAPLCVNSPDREEPGMTKEQANELQRWRELVTDTELAMQNAVYAHKLAKRNLDNFIESLLGSQRSNAEGE